MDKNNVEDINENDIPAPTYITYKPHNLNESYCDISRSSKKPTLTDESYSFTDEYFKNPNTFETLYKINVNDYTEKKNGLTYLSWAYAWAEVKKIYPNANYKVYETDTGCIYHTDGKTCWVKTGVIIEGLEHIEYLPVMDYRNKSIPLKDVTSFDVNKAIQRSLTKALARHGLGLYIYAGEDLPETPGEVVTKPPVKPQDEKTKLLKGIYKIAMEQLEEKTGKNYKDMTKEELCTEFTELKSKSIKKNK